MIMSPFAARVLARLTLLVSVLLAPAAAADQLTVGFSFAKPPFVFAESRDTATMSRGIAIDIMRRALALRGHAFTPRYMSYNELGQALIGGQLDAAATVRPELASVHYSDEFVCFHNFAITRADSALSGLADLAGRRVVAWQGATRDLGPAFAEAVKAAADYAEIGDQHRQVSLFLDGQADVLVIDGNIFRYWARQAGRASSAFTFHELFGARTSFVVGFTSARLRDDFNAGLAAIKKSGEYDIIFRRWVGE